MRFWYICQVNLNSLHAEAVHVKEIVKNLVKEGHDVTLFAPKLDDNIDILCKVKEITFKKSMVGYLLFQLKLLFTLITTKNKPDVTYVRHSALMIAPYIFTWLFKLKLMVEINGLFLEEVRDLHKAKGLLVTLVALFEKLAIRLSHNVVAVTEGLKEVLAKRYSIWEKKFLVIENGANTDLFKPVGKNEAFLKTGLSNNYRYLGFVGNLAPWQGVMCMIESFYIIRKENPEVKAVIVGNGPVLQDLTDRAKQLELDDAIIFTGSVPYEMVPSYINCFDVAVAPFTSNRNSKIGISPLKIYEYLACGKPVVASRIRGIDQLIEENKVGVLVEPDNPESLVSGIKNALDVGTSSDPDKIRAIVVKNYSWNAAAKKIIKAALG